MLQHVVPLERLDIEEPQRGVFLLHPKDEEYEHPQYLLGEAGLVEHIREVKAAEQALATTTAQLSSLGITD